MQFALYVPRQAADRARARTPALEPRIETASLASGSEANFAAAAAAAMGAAAGGGGGAMGGLGLGGGGLLVPRPLMPVALGMRLPNLAARECRTTHAVQL